MNRSQDAALGTGHLVALAAGGVIGLGVMSMPGIGIGIIGTGLWIAALVGLGFSVIALVPQLLLNSSGEYPGGQYQQLRDTVGRYVGGVGAYLLCFLVFDIAAYALSAAQLLPVPPLVARGVAILIIAVFVARGTTWTLSLSPRPVNTCLLGQARLTTTAKSFLAVTPLQVTI
ncbi:hypothetical protein [Bifidobacterium longum]|uniref:hypothetical protein n=1 Tax=Bifidobacterium longum TaxID=216816 RepID=UPI00351D28FB